MLIQINPSSIIQLDPLLTILQLTFRIPPTPNIHTIISNIVFERLAVDRSHQVDQFLAEVLDMLWGGIGYYCLELVEDQI